MMKKGGISAKENSICKGSEARVYGMFGVTHRRSYLLVVKCEDRKKAILKLQPF